MIECGRFDSITIQNQNLVGKNLKGLLLVDVTILQTSFDGTDLTGANFYLKSMNGTTFRGANLIDALIYDPDEVLNSIDVFKSIKLNFRTVLSFKGLKESFPPLSEFVFSPRNSDISKFEWGNGFANASQKKMVQDDVQHLGLNDLTYKVSAIPLFNRIFGSSSAFGGLQFFYKRIKYLDTYHADSGAIRAANFTIPIFSGSFYRALVQSSNSIKKMFDAFALPIWPSNPPSQQTPIPADDERMKFSGKMIYQPGFGRSMMKFSSSYFGNLSWPERLGMLIHEARHSDCFVQPNIANEFKDAEAEFIKLKNEIKNISTPIRATDYNLKLSAFTKALSRVNNAYKSVLKQNTCGQAHLDCPADLKESNGSKSVFAGMAGYCDQNIWGSYGVQAMYLKGLLDNCQNCTSDQKQNLQNIITDMLVRVSDLSELNLQTQSPDLRGVLVPVQNSELIKQELSL